MRENMELLLHLKLSGRTDIQYVGSKQPVGFYVLADTVSVTSEQVGGGCVHRHTVLAASLMFLSRSVSICRYNIVCLLWQSGCIRQHDYIQPTQY